jgi:hypothetical protein
MIQLGREHRHKLFIPVLLKSRSMKYAVRVLLCATAVLALLAAGCVTPPVPVTPAATPSASPSLTVPMTTTAPATLPPTIPATPLPRPGLTILSPLADQIIRGDSVTVTVRVEDFDLVSALGGPNVPGQGHLHYYIDAAVPSTPGQPALTGPGTYAPTTATSYTWTNVSPGVHIFSVQLVNNDHTPVIPLVADEVRIEVETARPVSPSSDDSGDGGSGY